MKFCNYCNAALEVGEDLFCSSCLLDGRQLKKVMSIGMTKMEYKVMHSQMY